MPTNRTRRRRNRVPDISPEKWAMLNDEPLPKNHNPWEAFRGPSLEDWKTHREQILARWLKDAPGTRPSHWWSYDAPGVRRVISGPDFYNRGPDELPIEETESFYCGAIIFEPWIAEDHPDEPLIVESQAAFLERHGLLTAAERRRLTDADFKNERIEPDG